MTSEIGDAGEKYRDKIRDEDDLDVSWQDLYDIVNGKPVYRSVPVKSNPNITFGSDTYGNGGSGSGNGGGRGDSGWTVLDRSDILGVEKNWGIKFTKRGKKEKVTLEFLVGKRGYQENQDETLKAMLERQIATGEYDKKGFHIDVQEDDVRYNTVEEKANPEESAHFIIVRDVSGSMSTTEELSYKAALYIAIGLQEMYKDKVTRVYVRHEDSAEEVSEEDFFKTGPGGGTAFGPAYRTVLAMLEGTEYTTKLNYPRKIDHEAEDVYVLHISDGGNWGEQDTSEAVDALGKILPKVTRFMYMQIGNESNFANTMRGITNEKLKVITTDNEPSIENVKKAVTALFN